MYSFPRGERKGYFILLDTDLIMYSGNFLSVVINFVSNYCDLHEFFNVQFNTLESHRSRNYM